jgi:hypothetical protein
VACFDRIVELLSSPKQLVGVAKLIHTTGLITAALVRSFDTVLQRPSRNTDSISTENLVLRIDAISEFVGQRARFSILTTRL